MGREPILLCFPSRPCTVQQCPHLCDLLFPPTDPCWSPRTHQHVASSKFPTRLPTTCSYLLLHSNCNCLFAPLAEVHNPILVNSRCWSSWKGWRDGWMKHSLMRNYVKCLKKHSLAYFLFFFFSIPIPSIPRMTHKREPKSNEKEKTLTHILPSLVHN